MYLYRKTEPGLWTVGTYTPDGTWEPDSDHDDENDARMQVNYLNGGRPDSSPLAAPPANRPHFVCIGDIVLNVDLIVDAGWVSKGWPPKRFLVVSFAAPTPTTVAVEDGQQVGVACRQILIPDSDSAAANLWEILVSRCSPPRPIGTMPGKVIAS